MLNDQKEVKGNGWVVCKTQTYSQDTDRIYPCLAKHYEAIGALSGCMAGPTFEAEISCIHVSSSLTMTEILSVLRIHLDKKLFRTPQLLIINHAVNTRNVARDEKLPTSRGPHYLHPTPFATIAKRQPLEWSVIEPHLRKRLDIAPYLILYAGLETMLPAIKVHRSPYQDS